MCHSEHESLQSEIDYNLSTTSEDCILTIIHLNFFVQADFGALRREVTRFRDTDAVSAEPSIAEPSALPSAEPSAALDAGSPVDTRPGSYTNGAATAAPGGGAHPLQRVSGGAGGMVQQQRGHRRFGDHEEHLYFWMPLLIGLTELTFDPRQQVRISALEVCTSCAGRDCASACTLAVCRCVCLQVGGPEPSSTTKRRGPHGKHAVSCSLSKQGMLECRCCLTF